MAGSRPAAEARTYTPPPSTSTPLGVTVCALFRRVENAREGWALSKSQATIRSNLKIMRELEIDLPDGRRVPFRDILATEVTKGVLRGLVHELEARGYAPATVKRKLDMVSKALSLAAEWDIIPGRPTMPKLGGAKNTRTRVVSEREEDAIFEAIAARHAANPSADWVRFGYLIAFLLDTGCRKGEAENLRREWITEVNDRHRLTIPGWATKNGKPRTIPLTPRIVDALPYLTANGVEAVDPAPRGLLLFPYRGGFIWYRWQGVVADLKARGLDLSDVVVHSFRHTTLTRLSERGLPIEKLADWAGHGDIKVTWGTYRHAEASSLDVGADLLTSR
jgi:integrase